MGIMQRMFGFVSVLNKCHIMVLLISLAFFCTFMPVNAEIIIIEPVYEQMNEVNGELVICPPVEGISERSIKLADNFFRKYNFDDELKEFVEEFIDDFKAYEEADCNPARFNGTELKEKGCGDRSFDEIFTDPRFDSFAKIVKLYPDYEGKGIYSNLKDTAEKFSGSLEIPQCSFENNIYVSGGLTIELEGKKSDNNEKESTYVLTSKAANKASFTLPVPSPGDLLYSHGTFLGENFYDEIRILKDPVLSFELNLTRGSNNFLQKKFNENTSKSTNLRSQLYGKDIMKMKLNTSMFCSESLHLAGYCNLAPPKYADLYSYNDSRFAAIDHDLDDVDYKDKKYLNDHYLSFELVKSRLTKKNSAGISSATLIANGKLTAKGYEGLKVFFKLDFTKGVDLPDANIIDFQAKSMLGNGTIVEVDDVEKITYENAIYVPIIRVDNANEVANGTDVPKLSWTLPDPDSIYRKYSISQIEVYRNKQLIATLSSTTSTYKDSSLTDANLGQAFEYAVVARDAAGVVKTTNGQLYIGTACYNTTSRIGCLSKLNSTIIKYGN